MEIVIKSLETRQQRYNSLVFATGPAVADAGKLRRLSCSEDDFIYFLPVAATSLVKETWFEQLGVTTAIQSLDSAVFVITSSSVGQSKFMKFHFPQF